jgi:periplasmic divalent cation tolerance protein
VIVCLTTVASKRQANKISRCLVSKKLAACVNILPGVTSFFYWKKKACCESEVLMVIKTTKKMLKKLEREIHLNWIKKSVGVG